MGKIHSLLFTVLLTATLCRLHAQERTTATPEVQNVIAASVLRVQGREFPRLFGVSNKSGCCQPGDTRNVNGVATIDLSSPKGMAKNKYVPSSGYTETVYSPPLSCWAVSTYSRHVISANDPFEASADAQPANFHYLTNTQFNSTLEEMKNYVANLNILDKYKVDIVAKLESFVKSYSSYANEIQTSHSQVRHRARVQGRGAFNGSSWYKAEINTSEVCCPPEVRDANALKATLKEWVDETATSLDSTAGPINKVALRSVNGSYVTAEGGGGGDVTCNRLKIGPWETFILVDKNGGGLISGDSVNLRASNGLYVVAENGGDANVNANRAVAGPWESFTIVKVGGAGNTIKPGDSVAFRSSAGKYLTAEGGGGQNVTCNRAAVGAWETFTYVTP